MFGKKFFESYKKGDLPKMEGHLFEALNEIAIHIVEGLNETIGKNMIVSEDEEQIDEVAHEAGITKKTPVVVEGVKGAKSTPFRKKFPTMEAFEKWSDKPEASDYEIHRIMKEELEEESEVEEAKFVGSWPSRTATHTASKPAPRVVEKPTARPKAKLGTKLSHYKTKRGSRGEVDTIDPDWDR